MTLNITLLTRRTIYQSSDFRLTVPDDNDPNRLITVTDSSIKAVSLHYPGWHGFVTYTGGGRWPPKGRDTSEWIVGWLQGSHGATLDDVIEVLSTRGTKWLEDIKRATGTWYKHTFIIGAFRKSEPVAIVISNFEDCTGRNDANASDKLSVSRRDFRGRPDVTVTGWKPAVSRPQRRALQRLAEQYPDDPARIRHALRVLNEQAANSSSARDSISPECTVLSLRVDGHGFQEVSETSSVEFRSVMNGMVPPDFKQIGSLLGIDRAAFKGASFGGSTPNQLDLAPCRPKIVEPADSAGYELVELSDPAFETSTARAINEAGVIIGAGTKEGNRATSYIWLRTPGSGTTLLPLTCANGSVAMDVNDVSLVVASAAMSDGSSRACRWDGSKAIDLGTFGGRDSGVRRLNNQGVIAGWVCIHPEQRGQPNFRPAAWSPQNKMEVLTSLPADWGEAVDVNSSGLVLVLAYTGPHPQALLWELGASCTRIGGERGLGFYPIGITDTGTVIGFAYDANGRHVAILRRTDGEWERLGTDPGWAVTAINADGDVVGTYQEGGFTRPWLRRSSGQTVKLPYFAYHHCRPVAVNTQGEIVGEAATDHGTHALLWRTT